MKKLFLIKFVIVTIIYFSSVVVCFSFEDTSEASSANQKSETISKSPIPYAGTDWELTNLKGHKIRLSHYKGQPVLLVFWATWCPYCKKLLPGIAALNEKYRSKGLKVIAVNIMEDWKPKVYWRNHEYQFDAVLEGDDVAKLYGVRGTPGVVFIAPSGKVLGTHSFSDPNHPLLEKFASTYTK